MNSEKYIGLDVHQATISVAVLDHTGKLVEEGTSAAWLYDLLKPHVARLLVCNPRKNALLKQGNKSDRIGARKLAELLRGNYLKSVYHGETGGRTLRELARSYLTTTKDLNPGDESPESVVSQLGDSLCRKRRLLYSPSKSVVGQDPTSGSTPASRTPLPTVG